MGAQELPFFSSPQLANATQALPSIETQLKRLLAYCHLFSIYVFCHPAINQPWKSSNANRPRIALTQVSANDGTGVLRVPPPIQNKLNETLADYHLLCYRGGEPIHLSLVKTYNYYFCSEAQANGQACQQETEEGKSQ